MSKSEAYTKENRIKDRYKSSDMKKQMLVNILIIVAAAAAVLAVNIVEYRSYQKEYNICINNMIWQIKESGADISDSDIISILDGEESFRENILRSYGIDMEKDAAILANEKKYRIFLLAEIAVILCGGGFCLLCTFVYNRKKYNEIREISDYISSINAGDYSLKIDNNTEDELSVLKNEVYKTTIMLKEAAENSQNDRLVLKQSLSDISHQIKTPLTSIIITLDNLRDNPDMDEQTRKHFLDMAKRDAENINFFVQSLLKLSRLDSNTVEYVRKEVRVEELIDASMKNVASLYDLKGIDIKVEGSKDAVFLCDAFWQTEALTNILKNAVEHASTCVTIDYEVSKLCTEIVIANDGVSISKKDMPHIFERFYRGESAGENSVGIGLALSKTIIEQDNGYISAETADNMTVFTIRYF